MADGSPRQILMFAPYSRWTPHLETDLEITDTHLAAGDHVQWMVCTGEMEICELNVPHHRRECLACVARRAKGLALLPAEVPVVRYETYLTDEDRQRVAALSMDIDAPDVFRKRMFDDFDVGLSAMSSVIAHHRDDGIDLQDHADELQRYLRTSVRIYLAVRNYLRSHRPDLVYLFNGRMAPHRAVLRACQGEDVPCAVHERGGRIDQYLLTHGDMPHVIGKQLERMRAGWSNPDVPRAEKVRIAEHWYQERSKGRSADGFAFTDRQELGSLPPDFRKDRRNIAIFTSSEWEINAVTDEWLNPLYPTSIEGIRDIIAHVADSEEAIHFYLRIHPSRDSADSTQVREFLAIDGPNVTVLGPDDPVSSYALMHACEKSVVTGSTMGVESTYWGKPSILAGQAVWRTLGGAHVAKDRDHLMRMVLDPDLPVLDREGALLYGYDRASMGQTFQHYEPISVYDGLYRGVRVDDPEQFLGGWPHGAGVRLAGASEDELNLGLLGIKARDQDGRGLRLEIERLYPGGPAHEQILQVGDVVVGVGRKPVPAATPYLSGLADALRKAEAGGSQVRLVVERPRESTWLVFRVPVPTVGKWMSDLTKAAARSHVLEQAVSWLVRHECSDVPTIDERASLSPTERLAVEGLQAHEAGTRAVRRFWKAHADTLTLARAPNGSLQPTPRIDAGAPSDLAQGGETRTTALWALGLAGGTRALQQRLQHAGAAS